MKRAAFLLVFTFAAPSPGAEPPKSPPASAKPEAKKASPEAQALAGILRELLVKNIPDPLTKANQNWGHQKTETVVKRHRDGLRFWTEPVQELHNDGAWRRMEVRIPEPAKLGVDVTELTFPEDGKILASVLVSCERIETRLEQQIWRKGLRLYSGETRAHCAAGLLLKIEGTATTDYKKGSLLPLPEFKLKVRATEAQLFHTDIVVDHTAGLDGDAAKVVGDVMLRLVKAVKPDLERDLLEKANAAIVKAAGTREFRLALDKLIAPKPKK